MTKTFFGTINFRIFIAVFITTFIITLSSSLYQLYRSNIAFDHFLSRQELEMNDAGFMRLGLGMERMMRLEMLNDDFRRTIVINTFISTLIGAIAAVGSALYTSKTITDPLSKMEKGMQNVIENRYRGRLEIEGPYEVQELIKRFNQLLDELDNIEAMRAELVSDITHELRTPLTKIQGQLEGIKDGVYKADDKQVDKILDNVEQLKYIIARLQDLIEIRAGKEKLKIEKVDFKKMLDSVLSGYNAKDKDIKFISIVDEGLKISADSVKFRAVLDNLIENAYKYTKKGEIVITANNNQISIKDSGIGISAKDIPYIFERFYRVDKSRSSETGGLGLGLAIVKEICDAHDFDIKVTSEMGVGTEIVIFLTKLHS